MHGRVVPSVQLFSSLLPSRFIARSTVMQPPLMARYMC